MRTSTQIQPQTEQAIGTTRALLRTRLTLLADKPAFVALVGEQCAQQIKQAVDADNGMGLAIARNLVHAAIVERNSGPNGVLWDLNDAINFCLDTAFGRWPFMTDDTRVRYLSWSVEGMETVERALSGSEELLTA